MDLAGEQLQGFGLPYCSKPAHFEAGLLANRSWTQTAARPRVWSETIKWESDLYLPCSTKS